MDTEDLATYLFEHLKDIKKYEDLIHSIEDITEKVIQKWKKHRGS